MADEMQLASLGAGSYVVSVTMLKRVVVEVAVVVVALRQTLLAAVQVVVQIITIQ